MTRATRYYTKAMAERDEHAAILTNDVRLIRELLDRVETADPDDVPDLLIDLSETATALATVTRDH